MKTLVFPPQSGIGHTTYVGVIGHQLTGAEAFTIAAQLAGAGLYVWPDVDWHNVLTLRPIGPVTTAGEGVILRAFKAKTDMTVRWDGPRRPVAPACLLCGETGVVLVHDLCTGCGRAFQPTFGEVS